MVLFVGQRLNAERKCKEEEGVKEAEQEKPGEMLFAQDVRLKAQAGTVPKKVRMLQVTLGTDIPEWELFIFFQHSDHQLHARLI